MSKIIHSDIVFQKYKTQIPDDKLIFLKFKKGCLKNKFPIYDLDGF